MDAPTIYVCGLVAYDGTDYHGFQYQANAPTIQGALEAALGAFANVQSRVVGAGRTDAGVHANGQAIAVRVQWRHSVEKLQQAWNAHLPASICIRQLQPAPEDFHPRFSALHRTYRYTVYQYKGMEARASPGRSPLTDRFALFETKPLDLVSMNDASAYLVGEHDFATFGQPTQGESTIRRVYQAEWQSDDSNSSSLALYPGRRMIFTVTANAFLRQMARSLVGALLEVGRGHWSPADMQAALQARQRKQAAPPASPSGLVLERVTYPALFVSRDDSEE